MCGHEKQAAQIVRRKKQMKYIVCFLFSLLNELKISDVDKAKTPKSMEISVQIMPNLNSVMIVKSTSLTQATQDVVDVDTGGTLEEFAMMDGGRS